MKKWSVLICLTALLLASCEPEVSKGGYSYMRVDADKNEPCRVLLSDMGRNSEYVPAFSARIEGCKH